MEDNIPEFLKREDTTSGEGTTLVLAVIQFLEDIIPQFESERIQPQAP